VKPSELSFETCRDITPAQCRSAPSQPKKARTDDGTIQRHVSHERRNLRSHNIEGSSVDSESASAIRHANTDRKSHNDGLGQNQRYSARVKHHGQISDSARKPHLFSYVDTSSSDDDEYIQVTQPRHVPKPPKYDGTTPLEGIRSSIMVPR